MSGFSTLDRQDIVQTDGEPRRHHRHQYLSAYPRLQDFIEGIKNALAPGGVFVIEAHYLVDLLEQGAFDTIYHEHVSYWALGP